MYTHVVFVFSLLSNMKMSKFKRELQLLFTALLFITIFAFFTTLSKESAQPWTAMVTRKYKSTGECDLFKGRWVWEERKWYYSNVSCPSLQDSKDCFKYGRRDLEFLNWRWKPDGCDLPRFEPRAFLEMVRGTKMAFVGDSIARNQADSLACLLSRAEIPEVTTDSEDKCKTWLFKSHNFTISLLWTEFLVHSHIGPPYQPYTYSYDLHVDRVDPRWATKLPGHKFVIISTDHWWFRKIFVYKRNSPLGCYFCDQEKNMTDLGLEFTYREAVRTALRFVVDCRGCGEMLAVLRTFSPAHFEGGSWDKGGVCNRTAPLKEEELERGGSGWELAKIQKEELERVRHGGTGERRFELMDVTAATSYRADGHPGAQRVHGGSSDCVHWCLPGPIDTWNDMLMALLQRHSDKA